MSLKRNKWTCSLNLRKPVYTSRCDALEEYQPKTLHAQNQYRRQYLATYPNSIEQSIDRTPLLLANVPVQELSILELSRRSSNLFLAPFNIKVIENVPSYVYALFQNLYGSLTNRLQIDMSILDYNLYRLYNIINNFISKYRSYEKSNVLFDHHLPLSIHDQYLKMLNHSELIILLEFFLQIDVDLFYMKTCSFRMEDQKPLMKSLFCTDDTPTCNYDFKPCKRFLCQLCQSYQLEQQQTIEFSTTGHKHRFVNGYEAILNCPANCQTNNIVYVLTCLCGQFDYISSTKHTLFDILEYHRRNANRIIIEYLLNGSAFSKFCTCDSNQRDRQQINRMCLYEHFAHCSNVLQLFLQHNPEYWCFIPQKIDDVKYEDLYHSTSLKKEDDDQKESSTTISQPPPPGFTFSKRQQDEQRQFFQTFNYQQIDSRATLDYYRASIVAVLPDPCSAMLRQMIEILFVTHAETKLNSMNLYSGDNKLLYGAPYKSDQIWCADLSKTLLSH